MVSVRPLTDLTVADLWREVKDPATLWGDVSHQTLRTVKLLLDKMEGPVSALAVPKITLCTQRVGSHTVQSFIRREAGHVPGYHIRGVGCVRSRMMQCGLPWLRHAEEVTWNNKASESVLSLTCPRVFEGFMILLVSVNDKRVVCFTTTPHSFQKRRHLK